MNLLIGILFLLAVGIAIVYSIRHAHHLDDNDEEGIR